MIKKYYNPLPASKAEFERKFNLKQAQKDLFLSCVYDSLTREDLDNIAPLTRVVGFPEDYTSALIEFFGLSKSENQREGVLALTFHTPKGSEFFASLDEKIRIQLSAAWVRPMLQVAEQGVIFGRTALLSLYRSTKKNNRDLLVEVFERNRIDLGCGESVYGELLAQLQFEARLTKAQLTLSSEVIH